MPRLVKQIAHLCVHAHDLEAAENFYCRVLGLAKVFEFSRDGARIGFYLDVGGRGYIEVFRNSDLPLARPGQVNHFCLEVENLDRAIAHLRAHRIEVTDKKLGVDDTWQAWLSDPSGTRIELFEYTPRSAQFVGGDRVANW
jgi:glyoxylase I family protein